VRFALLRFFAAPAPDDMPFREEGSAMRETASGEDGHPPPALRSTAAALPAFHPLMPLPIFAD